MRVKLIEDHSELAALIKKGLEARDFRVDISATGENGLEALEALNFDAVILDLGLPDQDGLVVLQSLRRKHPSIPVLILTSRVRISDVVDGLDAGADDYMTKPFEMRELEARLRALLRRPSTALGTILSVGDIEFDAGARQVRIGGSTVTMSRREMEVLELLIRRADRTVPKSLIEDNLYGMGETLSSNSVEVLIHRLRRRLQDAGSNAAIETVHGVGYMITTKKP
jgi:DNA-binding response OmpR family regulator